MNRPLVPALLLFSAAGGTLLAQSASQAEYFEKKIRPVLAKNCASCHNQKVRTAGLDLTTPEGILQGGQSGPLISKDDAPASRLLQVLSYDERVKMPPAGKLAAEELADIRNWVLARAPLPGAAETAQLRPASPGRKHREFSEAEKHFWAFQRVQDPAPPQVKNQAWVKSPIDRFILSKLEAQGLKPPPQANKLTLLRRVTFDLTGLPPSEQEITAFLADKSPEAFAKVVDRLLASPRYGEQWGRHWLDVARYADSTGNDEDHRYPYAWRYRDYVIDAFNRDLPFDQFVRDQIAGDLLPADHPGGINQRGIIATGFLALGAKAIAQQDKKKMMSDIYDEQIDVVSKSFLGLTLACARCHDHKFDPLLTRDYYSMVSIFANTRNFKVADTHVTQLLYTPLAPQEEFERYTKGRALADKKQAAIDDLVEQQVDKYTGDLAPHLAEYMLAARRVEREHADATALAREKGLRPEVLNKWISYLRPSGEARAHLEDWEKASDAKLADVAQAYQQRYIDRRLEWVKAMERTRAIRRKRMKDMPPPPIAADKDPFFYEVHHHGPFALTDGERESVFTQEARQSLATLRQELKTIEAGLPPEPEMACAVTEGSPEGGVVAGKIFIRGDYNSLGEEAPKGFPAILAGFEQPPITHGSGRLELAQWLTSAGHPLTARVFANRVWHWHFGEGIVRTTDNFGKMGDRPSHPELLDYLAKRLVEGGWSVKKLHRAILLSSAYQMSSETPDAVAAADPENKLFSRFPRRRLSVEEMRDGLLALDNSLDLTMGGTLQKGFGTDQENSNDRLSLRPEVIKRRMVYLPLRRANLPTLLNLFDFGDATTSASKRAMTTVAPQALFMMNSDFVAERAGNLAKMVLGDKSADGAKDNPARIRRLYLRILNRPATAQEVDSGLTYVQSFQQRFPGQRAETDAWLSFSRILLASNDFIYLD